MAVPILARSTPRSRAGGHVLHVHQLLMIRAIVVHDVQHRNAMMRGRPENAGGVVQIAVALDVDADAAVLLVGQRRAHRGRSAVADAISAVAADELIMLVEVPQAARPVGDEGDIGHQRPVFGLDLVPQFGGHAGGGDGAGVPAPGGLLDVAFAIALARLRPAWRRAAARRALRSAVISLRHSSIKIGNVACASAAMARSTSS